MSYRVPRDERFWARVDQDGPVPALRPEMGPCWVWTGHVREDGYATFGNEYVHRISYRLTGHAIPSGLELDHLCRVRHCVNPGHLEPVTHRVNQRRGAAGSRTHCVRGHLLAPPNLRISTTPGREGRRSCTRCYNEQRRARRAAAKVAQ